MKIQGFNSKEQKIFNKIKDGNPHCIKELKKLFWEEAKDHNQNEDEDAANSQAQSFVRNSMRRLVRDGWVEQTGRGTYRLTREGKKRITKGTDTTPSLLNSNRGRRTDKDKNVANKTSSKKVKEAKEKTRKELVRAKILDKASKTAAKADKENGHPKKVKKLLEKAKEELSLEERLAQSLGK